MSPYKVDIIIQGHGTLIIQYLGNSLCMELAYRSILKLFHLHLQN
jgi:hypothetical protein